MSQSIICNMANTVGSDDGDNFQTQIDLLQKENSELKAQIARLERVRKSQLQLIKELLQITATEDTETKSETNADLQVTMKAKENAARRDKVPNLCYKALKAQCTRGDLCNFSHDIVPFPYCRSYNDTGVCNYTGCGFLHRLYDYIPPESKDEKNVYSIQANRIGESTRRMPTVESGRQGLSSPTSNAHPNTSNHGEYYDEHSGQPRKRYRADEAGAHYSAPSQHRSQQYSQQQNYYRPQQNTPPAVAAIQEVSPLLQSHGYGYGSAQHAAYGYVPSQNGVPVVSHAAYTGYGNAGTPQQPAVGWFG